MIHYFLNKHFPMMPYNGIVDQSVCTSLMFGWLIWWGDLWEAKAQTTSHEHQTHSMDTDYQLRPLLTHGHNTHRTMTPQRQS